MAPATLDDEGLKQVEKAACPGAGACGGQFTANTMAMALSGMGLSPMGANDVPATCIKDKPARSRTLRPHRGRTDAERARTRANSSRANSLRNAALAVSASGGSTNAVLHLVAIATEAGVAFGARIATPPAKPHAGDLRLETRRPLLGASPVFSGGTRLVMSRLMTAGLSVDTPHGFRPHAVRRSA
jgi:dihydroxy-acid dehydratase